jgi:hypothetical protein
MKTQSNDRGSVILAVLAPILAAVIGGLAAVGATLQIINMAPSNSDSSPAVTQLSNTDIQYGN